MTLSPKDVCAILKACHANNVRFLSYQGLEVELNTPTDTSQAGGDGGVTQLPRLSSAKAIAELDETVRRAAVEAELDLREEEIDQLWIENPALAEKFVLSEDAEAGPILSDPHQVNE